MKNQIYPSYNDLDEADFEEYQRMLESKPKSFKIKSKPYPIYLSIQQDYENYFNLNSNVKSMSIDRLDQETLNKFWSYLEDLENTSEINVPNPENLEVGGTCYLSDEEKSTYLAAKVAHSIWKDKNELIPWRLNDYPIEELDSLIPIKIECGSCVNDYFTRVADYSPSFTYDYAKKFIMDNKENSLYAIIKDLRNFKHGISNDPTYPKVCVSLQTSLSDRISRYGCHSMTRIIIALAKSINLPSITTGYWIAGHSSALFYGIGYLPHGDDLYNSLLKKTPSSELISSWSYWKKYIEPTGIPTWPYPDPPNCNHWAYKFYASRQFNFIEPYGLIVIEDICSKDIENYVREQGTCNIKGIPTCIFNNDEVQEYVSRINHLCSNGTFLYAYSIPKSNLYIDDFYIGDSNTALKLNPGTYTLKLTKTGYKNYTENFTIGGGETRMFNIILEETPILPDKGLIIQRLLVNNIEIYPTKNQIIIPEGDLIVITYDVLNTGEPEDVFVKLTKNGNTIKKHRWYESNIDPNKIRNMTLSMPIPGEILNLIVETGHEECNWCNGADIDQDGVVSPTDLAILQSKMGRTDCSEANEWCDRADLNKSGAVNRGDVVAMLQNYGRSDCETTKDIIDSAHIFMINPTLTEPTKPKPSKFPWWTLLLGIPFLFKKKNLK